MTLSTVTTVAFGAVMICALYFDVIDKRTYAAASAIATWLTCVAGAIDGDYVGAILQGLAASIFTYLWWKNRRNGRWKKAARELGEKSKARVQALVEQMTPSPIPSPVGGGS